MCQSAPQLILRARVSQYRCKRWTDCDQVWWYEDHHFTFISFLSPSLALVMALQPFDLGRFLSFLILYTVG
jgi:hypothetical protein